MLLRHCPYSDSFGCLPEDLNPDSISLSNARQKVLNIILANRNQLKMVDERSHFSERSEVHSIDGCQE